MPPPAIHVRPGTKSPYELVGQTIWDMHNVLPPHPEEIERQSIAVPLSDGCNFLRQACPHYINKALVVLAVSEEGQIWSLRCAYSYDNRRFGLLTLSVSPEYLRQCGIQPE